ncbi:TPA: Sperm-associated antigen 17 [Trebouxia sp. C0004]
MNDNSRWRPVCLVVQAEGTIDLPAVKQWLQIKGGLKALELTEQAFATASGPIADSLAAAKQTATQAASDFMLTTEVKVSAVQQLFEADKASALAAEHGIRAKKETERSTALKAAEEEEAKTAADLATATAALPVTAEDPAANGASECMAPAAASPTAAAAVPSAADTESPEQQAVCAATKAHDTAKAALDQAKHLQQAAQASSQQPCFRQQPYWCDGASMTAKDLEDWQKAGLPFRAVVLLKASQESTPAQHTPPLLAELKAAQAACQPDHPLADIAIVEVALGEANSLFTPIQPPPSEEPIAAAAVTAAPAAKAPAKGAAAKGPAGAAAKGPAKGAAAAAADQAPPLGAPELGRALELLGSQVQQYYGWREGAKVMHLPEDLLSQDDLAGFKAILQDAPQGEVSVPVVMDAIIEQVSRAAAGQSLLAAAKAADQEAAAVAALEAAFPFKSVSAVDTCAGIQAAEVEPQSTKKIVYAGDSVGSAAAGIVTGLLPSKASVRQQLSGGQAGAAGQGPGDLQGVEAHMQSLMTLAAISKGKGHKIAQPAITAAGAARSALRAGCKDVPLETVERYNLLKRCVSMLPAGCQAAHESAIMARRHVEYFDPAVMLQVLSQATCAYPAVSVEEYPAEGGMLVTCHGGISQSKPGPAPARLQPFCEAWSSYVASKGSDGGPTHDQVYGARASQLAERQPAKFVYSQGGGVTCIDQQELCVRSGATVITLHQGSASRVTCTSDDGAVICCAQQPGPGNELLARKRFGLQCSTPGGISVELTSDAQVIMVPAKAAGPAIPSGRGVATHGAPLLSGNIEAHIQDSQVIWRSVLSSGEVIQAFQSGRVRVLFSDGCVTHHTLAAGSTPSSWTRTSQTGERWQEVDPIVAPPAASEAAPASKDATAEPALPAPSSQAADGKRPLTPPGKKAAPVTPAKDSKPKATNPKETAPAEPEVPPPEVQVPVKAPPAPQGPQPIAPLNSASTIDPETGATVTTRSDLVMIIDYVTGDRVVQDSDGTRVTSYAGGGFLVESAGLPPVTGSASGLTVEPMPGLMMQYHAADSSLHVDVQQTLQLVCSDSVVAFQDSQLSSGDSTQSVSMLRAAVATASHAKAAEVERLMAESQKELDVQNAAAAEQHLKDMADYEVRLTEAAAAWEADRKKKKGKAKDEAAPPPPPPPAAPVPQVAQPPYDPLGLADLVATAAPGCVVSACRYVTDLTVGSIALQDPAGPRATHMTFSANQQLSGWSPPAAAGEEEAKTTLAAAGPGPRIFVVFEDGSGYEVLDTDLFTAYAQRKERVAGCHVTDSEVQHAPEPGTRSITFLTRHELSSGQVLPLPPAEVALVRPATPPGALPALHPPSKVNTPPLLFLLKPRSLQEQMAAPAEEVYSFRQITQYAAFTPDTLSSIASALKAFGIWQKKQSQVQHAKYAAVHESRTAEDRRTAAELSARLLKLRNEHKDSAAHVASELNQGPVSSGEQRLEGAPEPKAKQKEPWPVKVGPYDHTVRKPTKGSVLAYWHAEEGLKANDAMSEASFSSQQLPIMTSNERRHPPGG